MHDNLYHVGIKKVLTVLHIDYWWPTMRLDVGAVVLSCTTYAAENHQFE